MKNKINSMLDLLVNEKVFSQYGIKNHASYWKIGTSPFNTFDRLLKRIENVDIGYPMVSVLNNGTKTQEGNNDSYQLKIQDINVTPCKVRGYTSVAAIHQYHSMICAFGLGVDDRKYLNKKDFVMNQGKIVLVANIKELLQHDNRIGLIKKLIVESFFSNIIDLRNISYSILIETLINFGFNFSLLDSNNQIFYWKKIIGPRKNKTDKVASLVENLETIKKDIRRQGSIGTYKEIIDCILQNYQKLDDFIDDIWEKYQYLRNENKTIDDVKLQIEEYNLAAKINKEYQELKNNIFLDRKKKKMISEKSDLYTDVLDENDTTEFLALKFNESHACHILEKQKIKHLLANKKLREDHEMLEHLLKSLSNPNNGLMMSQNYHDSFDRGQWSFDANGNMLVHDENKDYLFNIKGLKKIHINPEIFTEEMRDFLKHR